MQTLREYANKNAYINHQLEKTLDTERVLLSSSKRRQKIQEFKIKFRILDTVGRDAKILCVGSRDGEEVEAFKALGFSNIIGIDLVEFKPYTIKMDMHDLEYSDGSFDIVYTNSLDHSWDIKKALSEIVRVVRDGGIIVIDIELNNHRGNYETIEFNLVSDFTSLLDELDIDYECRDLSFVQIYAKNLLCVNHYKHTLFISIRKPNAEII